MSRFRSTATASSSRLSLRTRSRIETGASNDRCSPFSVTSTVPSSRRTLSERRTKTLYPLASSASIPYTQQFAVLHHSVEIFYRTHDRSCGWGGKRRQLGDSNGRDRGVVRKSESARPAGSERADEDDLLRRWEVSSRGTVQFPCDEQAGDDGGASCERISQIQHRSVAMTVTSVRAIGLTHSLSTASASQLRTRSDPGIARRGELDRSPERAIRASRIACR